MSDREPRLALSPSDGAKLAEIEVLAASGEAERLVARLDEPSWPVRRAVVGALARLGEGAVGPLVAALKDRREAEAAIAAAVDALVASDGEPVPALVAAAREGKPAFLCDVAQILGRRRSRSETELLARWALHEDDNVAVGAIEALGRLGGAAGIEALVQAASSGHFFRAFPAIDVLAREPDPRALPPLERLLADPLCGPEAARALGRRGEIDAVRPLAGLLSARADVLVRIAATALVELAERQRERFGTSEAVSEMVRDASGAPGVVTRRLARALADGDPSERAAICRVLGWHGDHHAAATLVELLDDEPVVAQAAAGALAALGEVASQEILHALREGDSERRSLLLPSAPSRPEVAGVVAGCLTDPEASVRARACEVLARAGAVSAVPALFEALGDPDPSVGQAALGAIQALGSAETEPMALGCSASPSLRVRRAGLRLLGYFGWSSGLQALIEASTSSDDRLRDVAIQGLAFLEDPRALEVLLQAAATGSPRTRAAAMRALGHRPNDGLGLPSLEAGLSDPDPWVRYYACQALGRLGASGALEALVERLGDEAGQVRIAVIDALARLQDPRATCALLEAARSADADLRRAALLGLGSARPAEGLPLVLEALQSPDAQTRVIALSALTGFEGPQVERALADAVRDPNETVRVTALGALAGRAGSDSTATLVLLLETQELRGPALEALGTHAPGRIPALLAALEGADAQRASWLVAALARMQRPDARAGLGVALCMESRHARRAAAAAFVAIGARSARLMLEEAAESDPDPEVRGLARHAIGR